jgi:hypothetical protein
MFSKYNHVWGWATWRRAWQAYSGDLSFWPKWQASKDWLAKMPDPVERRYWKRIFDRVHADQIDTWDYPWTGSVWYYAGLIATPNVNLVSNIGFGEDATHTLSADSNQASRRTQPLGDLIHPDRVEQNMAADRCIVDYLLEGRYPRLPLSVVRPIRSLFVKLYRILNG